MASLYRHAVSLNIWIVSMWILVLDRARHAHVHSRKQASKTNQYSLREQYTRREIVVYDRYSVSCMRLFVAAILAHYYTYQSGQRVVGIDRPLPAWLIIGTE